MIVDWQPSRVGALIRLRPLTEADFEPLYAVASDPLIWEQHPDRERHRRERFQLFFNSGIQSRGALAVIDQQTGRLIGSSRFDGYDPVKSTVEVGYTFLAREFWRQGHNRELKFLMLNEAFGYTASVEFYVGASNLRSRTAIERIGAIQTDRKVSAGLMGEPTETIVYTLIKENWLERAAAVAPVFEGTLLPTGRMTLEPITERDSKELGELFEDPELHRFVPFEPLTPEKERARTARWAQRRSPDGRELWLNWAARDRHTGKIIGHFQAGVQPEGIASVGYLVARGVQGQGLATEAMTAVFDHLRDRFWVREVKAWADSRNEASHRLARKLGMAQIAYLKDADFFKGSSSDELVFMKVLRNAN